MARTVYAVFNNPYQAERAVSQLVSNGFDRQLVAVRSSEPFLDRRLPVSADEEKTRIPLFALLGGVVGAIAGFSLAAATFTWMNLPTGGMSIVPLGPTGIITFEVTALGAIFGTLLTLFSEAELIRRTREDLDPKLAEAVADGRVLICVQCPAEEWVATVRNLMKEMNAETILLKATSNRRSRS